MFSIKPLPEFTVWLDELTDESVRGVVIARIKRLSLGLMGDSDRIAGWRFQTHPENRHQASQGLGCAAGLTLRR